MLEEFVVPLDGELHSIANLDKNLERILEFIKFQNYQKYFIGNICNG